MKDRWGAGDFGFWVIVDEDVDLDFYLGTIREQKLKAEQSEVKGWDGRSRGGIGNGQNIAPSIESQIGRD